MSSDGRLPGYDWVGENPRSGGGTYADASYYSYKPSILLHMTVSMGMSRSYISGHPYPPHLWANPYDGTKYQTVELDRSAFALYQPNYGYHWTNKKTLCLQTEIIGVPVVNQTTYTDAHLRWIAEHVVVPQERWLRARGLTANIGNYKYYTNSSGGASVDWGGRLTEQEWADFHGLYQHLAAWGNDHWDCSIERVDLISRYALEILDGGGEDDMFSDSDRATLQYLQTLIQDIYNNARGANIQATSANAQATRGAAISERINTDAYIKDTGGVPNVFRTIRESGTEVAVLPAAVTAAVTAAVAALPVGPGGTLSAAAVQAAVVEAMESMHMVSDPTAADPTSET